VTHTERDSQPRLRERVSSASAHAAVRSRLSDYLDGSLPPAEIDDIRQHLDGCAACQAFWRTLLRLINTAGQLPRRGVLSQAAKARLRAQLDRLPTRP
jgi:anti-sigma factor RsiW